MTGRSERPSRPPREKRKAKSKPRREFARSTYRQEHAVILLHFASKMAAAELYASKTELHAILAALRAEQRAALIALREREQIRISRQRQIRMAWQFAQRVFASSRLGRDPGRPRSRRRIKRRDKNPS
jgi:hypothetical protein